MKRSPMPSRKTPMKRGGPLARTPLKRGGPVKARTSKRVKADEIPVEFPADVRAAILRRAQYRCEVCRCASVDQIHHILRRSQGGRGTFENGLACCNADHSRIHGNPAWAFEMGYLLHSGEAA